MPWGVQQMTTIHTMRQIKEPSRGGMSSTTPGVKLRASVFSQSIYFSSNRHHLSRLYLDLERDLIKEDVQVLAFSFPLFLHPRCSVSSLCSWHGPSLRPLLSSSDAYNCYNWSATSHAWIQHGKGYYVFLKVKYLEQCVWWS